VHLPESTRKSLRRAVTTFMALWLVSATPVVAGDVAASDVINESRVEQALARLKADPNLIDHRTIHTLKWRDRETPAPRGQSLKWLSSFFGFIGEAARALIWVAGAILFALLLVTLRRLIRERGDAGISSAAPAAPSHVRELDIRPESLPPDIGAVAREFWLGGKHRAALSLLYRGALSHLVHHHRLTIRSSFTEGECLQAATRVLPSEPAQYFARLVRAWQDYAYGSLQLADALALSLCSDFSAAIDPPLAAGSPS
jgi:Domain of unknown function (DUF4129)